MKIDKQKIERNSKYYRRRLEIILKKLDLNDATILDLGCGEMILHDLLIDQIKSYKGIDQFVFSEQAYFISGNILDIEVLKDHSADFVFLLGVLDHLNVDEKKKLISSCKDIFHRKLVVSQKHPNSIINAFYPSQTAVVSIEDHFPDYPIEKVFVLKIPYTQWVLDVSKSLIRNWCTEIVYIVSKGNGPS